MIRVNETGTGCGLINDLRIVSIEITVDVAAILQSMKNLSNKEFSEASLKSHDQHVSKTESFLPSANIDDESKKNPIFSINKTDKLAASVSETSVLFVSVETNTLLTAATTESSVDNSSMLEEGFYLHDDLVDIDWTGLYWLGSDVIEI